MIALDDNKKKILVVVLSIFAILSLSYGILTPAKTRQAVLETVVSQITGQAPEHSPVYSKRVAARTKYASWGRDLFVVEEIPKNKEIILNGIVWDNNNPKVLIDGEFVPKGGKIAGFTVVEIKKKSAILNDGKKDIEIELKE